MLLALLPAALANPPTALPDAAPREPGAAHVAVGALGALSVEDPWGAVGGYLGAERAFGDRLLLQARLPAIWMPNPQPLRTGPSLGGVVGAASVSFRGTVVDKPALHLAPYVMLGGLTSYSAPAGLRGGGLGLLGVAMEGGGERVRVDASLSVLGLAGSPGGGTPLFFAPWTAVAFSEGGVSFPILEGHRLRLGLLSMLPTVGWMFEHEQLTAEVSVSSLGIFNVGRAELGWRF
ncbi:MAG: hypothetical protein H6739_37535 [Alphaproteobacteria bacterium]|nr:hypothetical protein [Alphaproteobacteria bacterium]